MQEVTSDFSDEVLNQITSTMMEPIIKAIFERAHCAGAEVRNG